MVLIRRDVARAGRPDRIATAMPANVYVPTGSHSRLPIEREHALYDAVMDLVTEVGHEALTMDTISTRAHTSKATLYRRWGGKPQLVAAALRHVDPVRTASLDTGTLCGDLAEFARRSVDTAPLFRAVTHAIQNDPEFHEAARTTYLGEVAPDCPAIPYFPQLIVGAGVTRPIVDELEPDANYLTDYFTAVVLPGLGLSTRS